MAVIFYWFLKKKKKEKVEKKKKKNCLLLVRIQKQSSNHEMNRLPKNVTQLLPCTLIDMKTSFNSAIYSSLQLTYTYIYIHTHIYKLTNNESINDLCVSWIFFTASIQRQINLQLVITKHTHKKHCLETLQFDKLFSNWTNLTAAPAEPFSN